MHVERVGYASCVIVEEVDLDSLVDRKRDDASRRHQFLRLVFTTQDLQQDRHRRRYEGVIVDEEVIVLLLHNI